MVEVNRQESQSVSGIAFLPWLEIREKRRIGPVRLLPYRRGELPGNLPFATQADIDSVLGAYADERNRKVRSATIVELDGWQTGQPPERVLVEAFRVRRALAFGALSERRLFQGHWKYCNADQYAIAVQRYEPGAAGRVAYTTRRRDGGLQRLWTSNDAIFRRPEHVSVTDALSVDEALVAALLSEVRLPAELEAAIEEFNCANSDSASVPEHVELVMMKTALEGLLGAGASAASLASRLHDAAMRAGVLQDATNEEGMLDWRKRYQAAPSRLAAWARDFSAMRGASAHANERGRLNFVLTLRGHLAFASILFPLLMRFRLQELGVLEMPVLERHRLRRIEEFLRFDPFPLNVEPEGEHPWVAVENRAATDRAAEVMRQQLNDAYDRATVRSRDESR